ncbi:MAG: calcium-binding protein [Pseudomonadota bacterium]
MGDFNSDGLNDPLIQRAEPRDNDSLVFSILLGDASDVGFALEPLLYVADFFDEGDPRNIFDSVSITGLGTMSVFAVEDIPDTSCIELVGVTSADQTVVIGRAPLSFLLQIIGSPDSDVITGTDNGETGSDFLSGNTNLDLITGGLGDDTVFGGQGDDSIVDDQGNDTISGGDRMDSIDGGSGNDLIFGNQQFDEIDGGAGNDTIDGGFGSDLIFGGDGDDSLLGNRLFDTIDGGAGNDTIGGGNNRDLLMGGEGNDRINGGADFDTLNGGAGDDTLTGGANADVFVFSRVSGNDVITDFDLTTFNPEVIDLSDLNLISDFETLQSTFLIQNAAGDAVIQIDADNSITLIGVTLADLTASNFIF